VSIPHKTQPAEEGAPIREQTSQPTQPTPPAQPAPAFAPKRTEFETRLSQARQQARETRRIAETHIRTLKTRLFHAEEELALGHTGLAAAHLMIGSRDLDAALAALPQL
jgi:hypothetical protein